MSASNPSPKEIALRPAIDGLQQAMHLGARFSRYDDLDEVFTRLLECAMTISRAEGGMVVKNNGKDLCFSNIRHLVQGIDVRGEEAAKLPGLPLRDPANGQPNHHFVLPHVAMTGKMVCLDDIYEDTGFDFEGTRRIDALKNYRTKSLIALPVTDRQNKVIAVLALTNARHGVNQEVTIFDADTRTFLSDLVYFAMNSVQNRLAAKEDREFVESTLSLLASATDRLSSSSHDRSYRLASLQTMLCEAAERAKTGPFAGMQFSDNDRYNARLAGLMSDFGRLLGRDQPRKKASRLDGRRDGVEEILTRIQVIRREMELASLTQQVREPEKALVLRTELEEKLDAMDRNAAFLQEQNLAGRLDGAETVFRLRSLANMQWTDWQGNKRRLLEPEELAKLLHGDGYYIPEEEEKTADLLRQSGKLVRQLKLPAARKGIREILEKAGTEADSGALEDDLNGETFAARALMLADSFERLTAPARAGDEELDLAAAVQSLSQQSERGEIDSDVFDLFMESRIWEIYAVKYMEPCRIGGIDFPDTPRERDSVIRHEALAAE